MAIFLQAKAAQRLQKVFRGHRVRRDMKAVLQQRVREVMAKKRVMRLFETATPSEVETLHRATLALQAAARGRDSCRNIACSPRAARSPSPRRLRPAAEAPVPSPSAVVGFDAPPPFFAAPFREAIVMAERGRPNGGDRGVGVGVGVARCTAAAVASPCGSLAGSASPRCGSGEDDDTSEARAPTPSKAVKV